VREAPSHVEAVCVPEYRSHISDGVKPERMYAANRNNVITKYKNVFTRQLFYGR